MKKIILILMFLIINLIASEQKEMLSTFNDNVSLKNVVGFSQLNSTKSKVYQDFKRRAFQRGNKIQELSSYVNSDILKAYYRTQALPHLVEDSLLFYDTVPALLEVDQNNNIVSIFVSYTQTFVMFNHFNIPSAPTENYIQPLVLEDEKLLLIKNYFPRKYWEETVE